VGSGGAGREEANKAVNRDARTASRGKRDQKKNTEYGKKREKRRSREEERGRKTNKGGVAAEHKKVTTEDKRSG